MCYVRKGLGARTVGLFYSEAGRGGHMRSLQKEISPLVFRMTCQRCLLNTHVGLLERHSDK